MSSPNNNSIVVGGAHPSVRRNVAPDSDATDTDMDPGSPSSTIDQPIDTSVTAKNAVTFGAVPASGPVIADAAAPEITDNQTNGADVKSSVMTEPRAIAVHPKTAPVNIARANNTQHLSIEELTIRQLHEDIDAYEKDQNFCAALLDEPGLTPQETRTIRIRQFDVMHQLRATRHRLEQLTAKTGPVRGRPAKIMAATSSLAASAYRPTVNGGPSGATATANGHLAPTPHDTSTPVPGTKRPSPHNDDDDDDDTNMTEAADTPRPDTTNGPYQKKPRFALTAFHKPGEFKRYEEVIRLGWWHCRLCQAPKYMSAGVGRTPAMPCKWPLRDTSKLIGHHITMHHEHTQAERCAELAVALDHNRGPLEYWLTQTKTFDIGDGSVIDEIVAELKVARIHPVLRQLSKAARDMEAEGQ